MGPLQCLFWIVVGGIAGSIANQLMGGRSSGLVADVTLGLIGAFIGGLILGLFHVNAGGDILSPAGCCANLVVAVFGACVCIGIGRMLARSNAVPH
jgi:uncharacterized membrane protein YeaQ/YmgE (transglycosylase-associated protein family)